MTTQSTATDSVPAEDEPVGPQLRLRIWPIIAVVAAIASFVVATTVQIPRESIAPGTAQDVSPLVHVRTGDSYRPKGAILLCTVLQQHDTILQAIEGWLDPDVAVYPQQKSSTSERVEALQMMDQSKQTAVAVAFQALGYDVIHPGGALITKVVEGKPAFKAGIKPGDVVTAIDGSPVVTEADARRLLGGHHPGETATIRLANREVSATLTTNPDAPGRGFLGVELQTEEHVDSLPQKVDIDSQDIGGPSAGLSFTLGVIDALTPGELTGGKKVAATGTIELDGTVGPIGGIAQKVIAVKRAGATVFLVPDSEAPAARKAAGKGLRIEPVKNLQDALRILEALGGDKVALDRR